MLEAFVTLYFQSFFSGFSSTLPAKPLFIENTQDLCEVIAALEDEATGGGDTIESVFVAFCRAFVDLVEGSLGGAAIDGEDGALGQHINGIVFPVPIGDHLAIDIQDNAKFPSLKGDGGLFLFSEVGNRQRDDIGTHAGENS